MTKWHCPRGGDSWAAHRTGWARWPLGRRVLSRGGKGDTRAFRKMASSNALKRSLVDMDDGLASTSGSRKERKSTEATKAGLDDDTTLELGRAMEPEAAEMEASLKGGALQAQIVALREELAKVEAKVTERESRNEVLLSKLSALQKEMSDKERESKRELSVLQDALQSSREAGAQYEIERERLHYVLAANGQEGSVPRSVLASDPDSLLYKMYCGEWNYARDEKGRALITCHPDRWAAIVEYLATGAVPAEKDVPLLAQARYWNLRGLVKGLEALIPGVCVKSDSDSKGFKAQCIFVSVMEKLGKQELKYTFSGPPGRWWAVQVMDKYVALQATLPPESYSKVQDLKEVKGLHDDGPAFKW
ncbi:hypothetical protein KFL_000990280 [Klebsormidium nitens]|uniref:Uncharacterized protein n=1 Tax=Klebsormidium nitens TaxID=105231 RepID=A0A1Y1I1S5_KLENI|nr:hypothetical protein KFL_000990280 [Klebsormidium nitens]|eukprot:GAQ82078.1 hypothetical protein KFL_000990280 [Klebsormidium nitens]